jgi:hypothetical protein
MTTPTLETTKSDTETSVEIAAASSSSGDILSGAMGARKLRSDATLLDPHRELLEVWWTRENCSYQVCCDRLKQQFGIDCSPKILCQRRQQWRMDSQLEDASFQMEQANQLSGQAVEELESKSKHFGRSIILILQARFINAASNPATTDVVLERQARMLQRFQAQVLRQEQTTLRQTIEANRRTFNPDRSKDSPRSDSTQGQGLSSNQRRDTTVSANNAGSPRPSISPSGTAETPGLHATPNSAMAGMAPRAFGGTPIRALTRAERKARIEAARQVVQKKEIHR